MCVCGDRNILGMKDVGLGWGLGRMEVGMWEGVKKFGGGGELGIVDF